MGTQEKKAWLHQYYIYGHEVERLKDEIARWRSLAEYGSSELVWAGGHGGGSGSPLADAVEHIILLEEELGRQLKRRVRRRREIEAAVGGLPDEGLRQVLKMRYVDAMGWDEIAERLCYSRRQVTRLHNRALEVLGGADSRRGGQADAG